MKLAIIVFCAVIAYVSCETCGPLLPPCQHTKCDANHELHCVRLQCTCTDPSQKCSGASSDCTGTCSNNRWHCIDGLCRCGGSGFLLGGGA